MARWVKAIFIVSIVILIGVASTDIHHDQKNKVSAILGDTGSTDAPGSWPTDPTADIPWSSGYNGVADIQAALNNAHTQENSQLGTSLPAMTLPSQATWDGLSDGQKTLWLTNQERTARGLVPLDNVETNVTGVAQAFADYLRANNKFGHTADGRTPWQRLEANPAIGACHDFLEVAENLAYFATSGDSIPLPVERAFYAWMYEDADSSWGHRHAILDYPYNDNSGTSGQEGFLGFGRSSGPYAPSGQPWNYAEVMVLNLFDPCATWVYPSSNYSVSGTVRNTNGAGLPNVTISAGGGHSTVSGSTGAYTISGLAAGNYTLTPSLSGYTFNPPSRSITIASANLTDQDFTGSTVAPPPRRVTYLPLLRRESTINPPPSGPKDGYWANSSTGYPEFSVASSGTQVVDFTIYINVTGCGNYTIRHNGSEPISANGFTYNNTFYFNGTFNSTTSASGIFGLANFYIDECGYVSTTHDMSWSADWQHAQLSDSLAP